MRLFAALVPPAEVVAGLAAAIERWIAREPSGGDRPRWIPSERWHLTIAFYGEVAEPRVDDLQRRLARAAERTRPVRLRMAGGGLLGRTVLYAGIVGVTPADQVELGRLADRAAAAGRRCGLSLEERAFRPHLTVARSRGADLRPAAAELAGLPEGPVWEAGELLLIRSQLGAEPRYRTVARLRLGPAAGDPD